MSEALSIPAVMGIIQESLWIILLVSTPLLIVSSVVGLSVAVLQAVTSINEASLSFIPKMATSGLVIVFLGGWILKSMVEFVVRMISGPAGP